ncbi:MAG: hypothetical protein IKP89_10000 [Bacteroidales bacterium]|nr:hypothetical protein [Bacteroidales bacterium]
MSNDKNKDVGLCGIFNKYTVKRNFVTCKSIALAVASTGMCIWLYFAKDLDFTYNLLGKIVDIFVGSVPDLLGFCIGGYAIIVAINGLDKMQAIVKPLPDKGKSYYHIISADFALTLVEMCVLLLVSYALNFLIDLELLAVSDSLGKVANLFFIASLMWMGVITVIMLMTTVANLFSTSMILQAAAIVAGKAKEQKDNEKTEMSVFKVETWFGSFTVTRLEKKK